MNHLLEKLGGPFVSYPQYVRKKLLFYFRLYRQNCKTFPFCGYYQGLKMSCLVATVFSVFAGVEAWLSGLDTKGSSDPSWPAEGLPRNQGSSSSFLQGGPTGVGLSGPPPTLRIRGAFLLLFFEPHQAPGLLQLLPSELGLLGSPLLWFQ